MLKIIRSSYGSTSKKNNSNGVIIRFDCSDSSGEELARKSGKLKDQKLSKSQKMPKSKNLSKSRNLSKIGTKEVRLSFLILNVGEIH